MAKVTWVGTWQSSLKLVRTHFSSWCDLQLTSPPKDSGHFKQHFEYTFDITLTFSNLLSRLSPCLSTEAAKEMSINGCLFQNIIFIISGRLDRSCAIFHVMEGHTVTTAFAKYVSLRGKGVKEIQKGFSPGDTHNICDLCLYASRDKSVIFCCWKWVCIVKVHLYIQLTYCSKGYFS